MYKSTFLAMQCISCLSYQGRCRGRLAKRVSLGAAGAKGFCVSLYNVCLYRQVICVYVKGPVKRLGPAVGSRE